MILKEQAQKLYVAHFGKDGAQRAFFAHGRLEIVGNHTDHNNGLCLVGGVDQGITAVVSANQSGLVKVVSEGYEPFEFDVNDLDIKPGEQGTTIALTRGVIASLKRLGYKVGGFYAAMVNDLAGGSGLSSSACYESMVAEIVSALYNDGKVPPLDMALASQYAEVVYFGKPCGMLDQVGSCYGGIDFLDFKDPKNPVVEPLVYDLPLSVILVNPGSSHAGLTDYYASIPADMKAVAENVFGKHVLREVDPAEFGQKIALPSAGVSERAKLRAQHYMDENRRVLQARQALITHNVAEFLDAIKNSGYSSSVLLANTMVPGRYEKSPQEACDVASRYLGGGACRVMGGGFAGGIIAFIPQGNAEGFVSAMKAVYGEEAVQVASIPAGGPCELE